MWSLKMKLGYQRKDDITMWGENLSSFPTNNISWMQFVSRIKVQHAKSWFNFSLNLKWMEESE
jgi:hypothetical protein